MKQAFLLTCLFFLTPSLYGKPDDSKQAPSQLIQDSLLSPYVYNSVNVITGEYCESQTDLALEGPHPLTIRRFYNMLEQESSIQGLGWHFNHPNLPISQDEEGWQPELSNKKIHYDYDDEKRLKRIATTDLDGATTYNWLDISYRDGGFLECDVAAPDGRHAIYSYSETDPSRTEPGYLLESVILPNGVSCRYQYRQHPTQRKHLIIRRDLPDGRCLEMEYYGAEGDDGADSLKAHDPLRGIQTGRVKLQKAPHGTDSTPIVIHRFSYGEGYTEVRDALDCKTIYRYGENKRLTAIESFLKDETGADSLYRIERLYWQTNKVSGQEQMVSRTLEDAHGTIALCRHWEYDPEGSVARETIYGNLTGKNTCPILMNDDGRPCNNGVEHYSIIYHYTDDDSHLLAKQQEDNGNGIRYIYDPDTQRLKAKLLLTRQRIAVRHFYSYDQDGILIQTIIDDGYTENSSDLQGISERRIINIIPSKSVALFGLPEIIEEKYLDLQTGDETVLKQTLLEYSYYGKLLQKTVFNAQASIVEQLSYGYDRWGRQISTADEKGNITTWEYDANGNKIALCVGSAQGSCQHTHNIYDYADRLIRTETCDGEGKVTSASYRYDAAGNKIASVDTYGNETLYSYDSLGRVVMITAPEVLDSCGSPLHPATKKGYDICDNPTLSIDPKGYETRTFYNARGKPIEIHYPDGTFEKFEYALDGSLQKSIAKNGTAAIYHRDDLGRVRKMELAAPSGELLSCTESTYNSFHLVSSTDGKGTKSHLQYDGAGRQIHLSKGMGESNSSLDYEYDGYGQVKSAKEWYGNGPSDYTLTLHQRDEYNRLLSIDTVNAAGEILKRACCSETDSVNPCKTIHDDTFYNDRGQNVPRIEAVDASGNTAITIYDALGRVESILHKNCLGMVVAQTEIRYDAAGNKSLEVHKNPLCEAPSREFAIAWRFGPNNRLESMSEGVGTSAQRGVSYLYNTSGFLETIVKADGVQIIHEYNPAGYLQELKATDNSINYRYHYDKNFNIIKVEDLVLGSATERTYTEGGRLSTEILGNGLMLRNRYDRQGRRTELILPDNSGVLYQYDAAYLREVQRISTSKDVLYTHAYAEYNLSGEICTTRLIGPLGEISYKRDSSHRTRQISCPFWSENIPEGGYDLSGNLLQAYIDDAAGHWEMLCQYDAMNQIVEESNIVQRSYAFDSLSNRIAQNSSKNHVDELNQLQSTADAAYRYDSNGNIIEVSSKGTCLNFSYDALNRLIKAATPGCASTEYAYDAFHRRLSKTSYVWDCRTKEWKQTGLVRYLYDGQNDIGSADPHGRLQELRILGSGLGSEAGSAVAIELNGSVYAPIHDHRGSICCLVDMSRQLAAECYRYSAFGERQIIGSEGCVISESAIRNPWGFAGKRLDEETGLVNFGKRYYSPEIGRWTTQDPLGFADGPNLYAFVRNNPLTHIDLYGLFSLKDTWQSLISFCATAQNTASNIASYLQSNLSYQEYIRDDIEDLGHKLVGKFFLQMIGYYTHPPEAGVYGNGELNDKVRITLVNGILCIKPDFMESIKLVSETHGGVNVHYIFRPTEGWAWDLIKSCMVKCGFVSVQAQQLAETWKKLIQEMGGPEGGGLIIHYAHSIGGTDTYAAKHLLTPAEQQMIKVFTLGSATMIPNHGFQCVINFVSRRDGVTLLDPISRIMALFSGETSNIVYIGTHAGIPFIDHLFDAETYRSIIQALGSEFVKVYGSIA